MISNRRICFERILCPTDLSPDSDVALRYAVTLTRAYGAKLYVCHSVESLAYAGQMGHNHLKKLIEHETLSQVRFSDLGPFDWEGIVFEGNPSTKIPQEASQRGIDLIVMHSRRRPNQAALLGSTVEAVCRTAPCPVLVTHRNEHEWVGLSTNAIDLQRVLVAYDFSNDSELALTYGLSLAQEFQAELHALHVLPVCPKSDLPEISELSSPGNRQIENALQRLYTTIPPEANAWCELQHIVRVGKPYREILTYSDEHDIDLICMGVSGRDFGMHSLFGSNVDRVVRQSSCPILIARPLKPEVLE